MYVASTTEIEVRLALEAMVELANGLPDGDLDLRAVLEERGFSRAAQASEASMKRAEKRLIALLPMFRQLPDADTDDAALAINVELSELDIRPAVIDHDGVGHHMHWTPSSAKFDEQMLADMLMALAQEVCDNGTLRFGVCGAEGCDNLFYDATRNRSKRFCSNSACASRTHTADHRARRRDLARAGEVTD